MSRHLAIGIDNQTTVSSLIDRIVNQLGLGKLYAIYDKKRLDRFIDEEAIHDDLTFIKQYGQSLFSMSSGQQKIHFIKHILSKDPKNLILINPLSHLDPQNQEQLQTLLADRQESINFIFIFNRGDWVPSYIDNFYNAFGNQFEQLKHFESFTDLFLSTGQLNLNLDPVIKNLDFEKGELLVRMKDVCVSYSEQPVLNNINWTIRSGDFWELRGPNGSGKTTLLTMITGENPKAYGQDLFLFGYQKGTGETVWDIKKNIGYFTPSMTAFFKGYYSVEEMIVGGLKDSVGLYVKPSKLEEKTVSYWMNIINMSHRKNTYFVDLSLGEQCLVMTARAMVKNPKLLILDEPTAGMDQQSNELFIKLVNSIAKKHQTAIVFVSHKRERDLATNQIFELIPHPQGSQYRITDNS